MNSSSPINSFDDDYEYTGSPLYNEVAPDNDEGDEYHHHHSINNDHYQGEEKIPYYSHPSRSRSPSPSSSPLSLYLRSFIDLSDDTEGVDVSESTSPSRSRSLHPPNSHLRRHYVGHHHHHIHTDEDTLSNHDTNDDALVATECEREADSDDDNRNRRMIERERERKKEERESWLRRDKEWRVEQQLREQSARDRSRLVSFLLPPFSFLLLSLPHQYQHQLHCLISNIFVLCMGYTI